MSSNNTLSENPIFAPTQVSGCSLWLDAADPVTISASGSSVTSWADKSGNTRTLSNKLGTVNYGTYQNLPCVQTNSGSLSVTSSVDLTQYTFFMVCLSVTSQNNQVVFSATPSSGQIYDSTSGFGFYVDASNPRARFYGGSNTNSALDTVTSYNGNAYGLTMMSYTVSSTMNLSSFVNGNTGSTQNTNSARTNTCQGFFLGYTGTSEQSYSYIHEVIVYNSVLSTSQRQLTEGYLAWKWGLSGFLPSNHPYKNTPVYGINSIPRSMRATLPVKMAQSSSPFTFFNPTSIPGCILWLDPADTNVFTGGANWIDKSGTSNTGITGTPPTTSMPTITSWNGLQSARFLAANKTSMKTTNTITNMPVTYVMAVRSQASSFGRFLINNLDGQRQISITPPAVTASGGVNINIINAGIGQEFQMCVTFSTGATVGYANGSQSGASGTASTSAPSQNYFGSDNGDGGYLSADLGDILIYNSVLSGSQRQLVEGYLAWKWGLSASLPSNHPFKNTPPGLAVPSVPLRLAMNNRSFSPTAISNCILWLDASDRASFTLSGNTLASIQDKSPTAKTITVNSAPTYNSTIFNTFPGFVFASGNRLSAPTSALGSSMTLIAVYCITSNVTSVPLSVGLNGNETGIGFNSFYAYYNIYDNGVNESGNTRYTTINTNLIHIGVKSPTTPNLTSYVSGISSTPVNSGYSNANTTIYISGGFSFIGNLAESIVYSSALSLPQVQQVEGYLAWKWGLVGSLPANHPYKKWPPPPN